MTNLTPPDLGNNGRDLTATVLRASLGAIPVLGPIFAELSQFVQDQRMDRVVRFATALSEKIADLDRELMRTKLLSPQGSDLLEDALNLAVRSLAQERTENISRLMGAALRQEPLDYRRSKMLLKLLGQVTDEEIVILRGHLPENRQDIDADHLYQNQHIRPIITDATQVTRLALKFSEDNLVALNLMEPEYERPAQAALVFRSPNPTSRTIVRYQVTLLGKLLLKELNLIPAWFAGRA